MNKYYTKISFLSRIIHLLFLFSNSKRNFSTSRQTQKFINKLEKKPKKINIEKYNFVEENYKNLKIYTYNGTLNKPKNRIILYIHGGSFVEEVISYQIKFAKKIAQKTNSTLVMPIYPLLPNGNYKIMYDLMYPLYKKISKYDVNLLGDSAGGGFILSFSMFLRDNKEFKPNNVIMMSPWLDLSLSNPDLLKYEKLDTMCAIEGNKYAGALWSKELDIKNFLVSPLYGTFNDLPNLTIITGGRDLMKPDCVLLSNKLNEMNIYHNYIEYKNQGHDFGAYPTKEGRLIIEDISSIINGGEKNEQ